jgi:hypothetical protein
MSFAEVNISILFWTPYKRYYSASRIPAEAMEDAQNYEPVVYALLSVLMMRPNMSCIAFVKSPRVIRSATPIRAAIKPYSIIARPSSSLKNLLNFFIFQPQVMISDR